jgi:hypothetical protein
MMEIEVLPGLEKEAVCLCQNCDSEDYEYVCIPIDEWPEIEAEIERVIQEARR